MRLPIRAPSQFTWAAENYVKIGSVHPSALDLAPGKSALSRSITTCPRSRAIWERLFASSDRTARAARRVAEIPVSLRTLIPIGTTGGSFTGTITGGNGRAGVGPYQTYEFQVPAGHGTMSLNLQAADSGDILEGVLVDPNGMQMSVQPNADVYGNQTNGMTLSHYSPQPGRWRFTLMTNFTVSGNETSSPFTGQVSFSHGGGIGVKGLPNNPATLLSASGEPVTVTVNVTNKGSVTQAYFADSRLRTAGSTRAAVLCSAAAPTRCRISAGSTSCPPRSAPSSSSARPPRPSKWMPTTMSGSTSQATGNPDIFGLPAGKDSVLATLAEPEVPWGAWITIPSLIGPYGPAGAPTTPVITTAFALMQPFDAAMSPSTGDPWADLVLGGTTYSPLILAPGESGTMTVTITPDASAVGSTVNGYLYVDTYNSQHGDRRRGVALAVLVHDL